MNDNTLVRALTAQTSWARVEIMNKRPRGKKMCVTFRAQAPEDVWSAPISMEWTYGAETKEFDL